MSPALRPSPRPSTSTLLLISAAIQLALLAYSTHVDSHPEQFKGLKYTDVDWRVVYDGLYITAHPKPNQLAQGILAPYLSSLGLTLGSPYHRATFRYTPLLVFVLSPALISQLAGRLVLVALTLAVPVVLISAGADFWKTHLLWTLNPIVLNISTRGSPEALPCLLTAGLVLSLRNAGLSTNSSSNNPRKWEAISAILLALATSYKLYPAIYVPSIWLSLSRHHGFFGPRVWRFGLIAATTALLLNTTLYLLWGHPFLQNTYLYHLTRQDHRHNFSIYFLKIYLSSTSPSPSSSPLPLPPFLPQTSLILLTSLLTPTLGLETSMFFQTTLFVIFNKVCTSQYFLWPIPFIPMLKFSLSWWRIGGILGMWVIAQAIWLALAYKLEFGGEDVYLPLWGAGSLLLGVSCYAVGVLLDSAVGVGEGTQPEPETKVHAHVQDKAKAKAIDQKSAPP